jgi:hypothetical protein
VTGFEAGIDGGRIPVKRLVKGRFAMRTTVPRALAVLALCGLFLLGVVACGGGGAEVRSEVTTTTKGQQLLDLKKALDSGAMTKDEYEKERKKILEK